MRDTIKGAVIGAVVAAGVSVLLAQTPTWSTPRTWATDDLLTATQFNAQFRDNLLWLRQDAQLTGTPALLDLGCGTLGTNEVLFSDCTWATIPDQTPADGSITTVKLADDAVTQPKIADSSVGRDQLRTATMNFMGTALFAYPGDGYAFFPVATNNHDSANVALVLQNSTTNRYVWRRAGTGSTGPIDVDATIRYLTSSDNPSLWVVLDATGIVTSLWEAEDPISTGDTVPPLGTDEPGHTVVDVGLPSLAVIESVYTAALTSDQRTAALTCTGDYVTGRGWLSEFTGLSDLSTIEARYEPSGRQWAMRCGAQASDESVPTFYQGALVVSSGAWAVAP